MKRMAIIFNSDFRSWPMGGMISYVTQAAALLADSYEIELWGCRVDGREPEPIALDGRSYPIHTNSTALSGRKLIPNVVKCFWGNLAGSGRFRAERYDILYFHLSASALGWFAGEFLRRPFDTGRRPLVIMHQHGMAYHNTIGDRLDYLAMDLADLVFLTTDRNSLLQHQKHTKNPHVIWMPSMVDTDFFCPAGEEEKSALRRALGIPAGKTVFIYTGRITGWKNPALLLDAFSIYQSRCGCGGYLIYVGDGDALEDLRRQVKESGLEDSVLLAGRQSRDNICAYLRAADVFALPSRGEGVSVSALEAMAAGLPVVAFDVEGMNGLVEPCSGVLVSGQTPAAYADGLEQAVRGTFRPTDTAAAYALANVRRLMVDSIENAMNLKEHKQ